MEVAGLSRETNVPAVGAQLEEGENVEQKMLMETRLKYKKLIFVNVDAFKI
jgi:hypothetical protein